MNGTVDHGVVEKRRERWPTRSCPPKLFERRFIISAPLSSLPSSKIRFVSATLPHGYLANFWTRLKHCRRCTRVNDRPPRKPRLGVKRIVAGYFLTDWLARCNMIRPIIRSKVRRDRITDEFTFSDIKKRGCLVKLHLLRQLRIFW